MYKVENPTDRGKGGVKRSLLTEAEGIPVGLAVDGANRHDMKLVRATVESLPVPRPAPTPDQPQGMCLDKGYDFDEVRRTLEEFGFTAHLRSRGEEAKAIKRAAGFKARRWVVERTHGWLNRCGASWCAGTSPLTTTSPFCISLAPLSPSEPPGY